MERIFSNSSSTKGANLKVEFSKKLIKISLVEKGEEELIRWYTPASILWHKWNNNKEVLGVDAYKDFREFKVHYIGISNEYDHNYAFRRLVEKVHEKRLKILTHERLMDGGYDTTLSDEIYLLFFYIDRDQFLTKNIDDILSREDLEDFLCNKDPLYKKTVNDAEKSLVSLLKPKYNKHLFDEFPNYKTTLASNGLHAYSFLINDDVSLKGESGEVINGSADMDLADEIIIHDNEVSISRNYPNGQS